MDPKIKVGDNSLETSSEKIGLSLTKFDQLNWEPTGQSLITFKPLTVSTLDLIRGSNGNAPLIKVGEYSGMVKLRIRPIRQFGP